jgi:hypothetical protein
MQTEIFWESGEYDSTEKCQWTHTGSRSEIRSAVDVKQDGTLHRVEYHIKTNENGETLYFHVANRHDNLIEHFIFESDGKGNWQSNHRSMDDFKGCIDIDMPITPSTNSLPIHRLNLPVGGEEVIQVLYVDILSNKLTPVKQKYTRLSDHEYKYENVPNDFETTIRVDESGFVVDYPGLFVRKTIKAIV